MDPQRLGSYQLLEPIGEGGFADVYLALNAQSSPCLVKVLKQERAKDRKSLEAFLREVRIATSLKHPNIVSFVDYGSIDQKYYAVMEISVGLPLSQLLADYQSQKTLPPIEFTMILVKQIVHALSYLHTQKIFEHSDSVAFHGDISPDNLLMTDDGKIRIMDFGSAGAVTNADRVDIQFGKLAFLPYEVIRGKPMDPRTDIYAFGIVTFCLLFGRRPFEGATRNELVEAIRSQEVPRLDCVGIVNSRREEAALRIFFHKALNKNPGLRFQSIRAFGEAFYTIGIAQRSTEPQEFQQFFPSSFTARLKSLRADWVAKVKAGAKAPATQALDLTKAPREPIVARQNVRKHPRIQLRERNLEAEVVAEKEKWRSKFLIQEISRGGILLQWRALNTSPGIKYPISFQLADAPTPITAIAEVRYEITQGGSLCAGMKFSEIAPDHIERIEQFVQRHLKETGRGSAIDAEALEVFFRNPFEWKLEYERNIRHGGLFIRAAKPYTQDQSVTIRIHLPNQSTPITLIGKVVYSWPLTAATESMRKHGVGVQLNLTVEQLKTLNLAAQQVGV